MWALRLVLLVRLLALDVMMRVAFLLLVVLLFVMTVMRRLWPWLGITIKFAHIQQIPGITEGRRRISHMRASYLIHGLEGFGVFPTAADGMSLSVAIEQANVAVLNRLK